MVPDVGLLAAVGVGLSLGAAIVLLVAGLRGPLSDASAGELKPGRRSFWPAGRRARAGVSGRLAAASGAGAVILVLTRWPVAALAVAALILAWPYVFGGAGAEQAAIARLEALVVWTESLRDTVAANASLEQAISASIYQAPAIIKPALDRLAGRLRVQTPLDTALLDLAGDLDDASADLVIAALVLNVRRRGDRLAQVLSNLAASAREELDLRRRITAGRAGLRRSVQIVVVITVGIAAYLVLFGGAYLQPYRSPLGQGALAVVAALFAAGFVWMRRLSLGDDTPPLLSRDTSRAPADPADTRLVTAMTGSRPLGGARQRPPAGPTPTTPPGRRGDRS